MRFFSFLSLVYIIQNFSPNKLTERSVVSEQAGVTPLLSELRRSVWVYKGDAGILFPGGIVVSD